nr:Chain A, Nematocyst outer wall antigen [Hydra vulgaris]
GSQITGTCPSGCSGDCYPECKPGCCGQVNLN